MLNNARNDSFYFRLPKGFIPKKISDKYIKYLEKIPGNIIKSPAEFVNYGIQALSLPGMSYDPVEQTRLRGRHTTHLSSVPYQELINKEFTLSMQLLNGNINYWIMFETFKYWYEYSNDPYLIDGFVSRVIDDEGFFVVNSKFDRVLFKDIGGLELNNSSNAPDFNTFDCVFTYNKLLTTVEYK